MRRGPRGGLPLCCIRSLQALPPRRGQLYAGFDNLISAGFRVCAPERAVTTRDWLPEDFFRRGVTSRGSRTSNSPLISPPPCFSPSVLALPLISALPSTSRRRRRRKQKEENEATTINPIPAFVVLPSPFLRNCLPLNTHIYNAPVSTALLLLICPALSNHHHLSPINSCLTTLFSYSLLSSSLSLVHFLISPLFS